MFKSYLKIGLRNFYRNKVYIIINILGLGIALACCIGGYFNWKFKDSWDANHIKGESIYRIQFWQDNSGESERYGVAPLPLGDFVKSNVSDLEAVVRYLPLTGDLRLGTELVNTEMVYADSAFFDLFTFKLLHGVVSDFFDKSKIFISEDLARKYFKDTNVVGKEIIQVINGVEKLYIVGGVFEKQPLNSSFSFETITVYENVWDALEKNKNQDWSEWNTLFLQLSDASRVSIIESQLQQYVEPQNKARKDLQVNRYYLENFVGMANRNLESPTIEWQQLKYGVPPQAISVPSITAILLWLLACFNFTNTSVAISNRRLKEIGIRKVMGSDRKQLILQFFGENFLMCFFSLLAGLVIAEFLIPAYNSLWPSLKLELNYSENIGFILFLVFLLFFTATLAGSYPAFYTSSHEPISILKDKIKLQGTNWINRALLVLTFTISMLAIIFAMGFFDNAKYQEKLDFGYATSDVITVPLEHPDDYEVYKNALLTERPGLLIAASKNSVINSAYSYTIKFESAEKEVEVLEVGENYIEALEIKVKEGRTFQKDSESDRRESALVTEEFIRQFGWSPTDAIGKRIIWNDTTQLYIIGVINDLFTHSLYEPVGPVIVRSADPKDYQQFIVNTSKDNIMDVEILLKEKWATLFPNSLFYSERNDIVRASSNRVNINGVKIVGCLGVIALLISITGLYTMVSLNINKKTKEIGIRKVLGASQWHIAKVINMEFIIILGSSALIGGLLGKIMIDNVMSMLWLYYLNLQVSILIICIVVMLVTAFIILGIKTHKTASLDPTKTIRSE